MYNFTSAFVICAVIFVLGEIVSNKTKAWIPSVFVSAVLILLGYWTIIPTTLVSDAQLIPFGSTVCIYMMVTHMGTVISIRQLLEQWKTIVICIVGLGGLIALTLLICPLLMDRSFVIAGLPPLTGGLVAATIMQQAAEAAGLKEAAVFAIALYCIQGFAGYPLTSVCLQLEGKKMLREFRSGAVNAVAVSNAVDEVNGKLHTETTQKKKLLPSMPSKYNSIAMLLGKLVLVAWFATVLSKITFPLIGNLSGAVWALVLGVIFTGIGFLDENILNKANSYGLVMFAVMMYIFDGLKDCSVEMLSSIIGPMVLLIIVGVIGMGIMCLVISKILKTSFLLSFATALTALYGFPPNAIITESTCEALSETPEEKSYLMSKMFAPMIVGGFVTVTITSVILAGLFAPML